MHTYGLIFDFPLWLKKKTLLIFKPCETETYSKEIICRLKLIEIKNLKITFLI